MRDTRLDEVLEAKMAVRLCELKVLCAKTTVAVGAIGDLIYQSRKEPYINLVLRLLKQRGLLQ
jgi:hypothetical protein